MGVSIIVQGIIVGLVLAVPVGPLSLICIQRTLSDGKFHGILSGLGVTTADSVYAAVAFLGLTAISSLLMTHQGLFRAFAGIVLIAVGIRIIFFIPDTGREKTGHESYIKDFLSMGTLAIANPLTLIFLMVTLPGYGFVFGGTSLVSAGEFIFGFFCGSAAWWIFLCGAVGSVRSRISTENLALVNRLSGIFIICVGTVILISLVLELAGRTGF